MANSSAGTCSSVRQTDANPEFELSGVLSRRSRWSEYFTTRETERWRADIAGLSEPIRSRFIEAAHSITRSQARKPLGRSHERLLYTLPVSASCRLVYSIDAGIAVLARAFGQA